ncbi:MAG: class I SAM-dependent methyltransferase [Leptospirales bacterium]
MNHCPLTTAASLTTPARLVDPNPWIGHTPFAFWLIEQARPRGSLVELGTRSGNSYFTFCQAVLENGLTTRCYAVDTWEEDLHSKSYGEEIYQSVTSYNNQHYRNFSSLLRMRFDEALPLIPDRSIDLLHIDGLHTYEVARHDFESFSPKLSDSAIVLFHDTAVREKDFGVWRLWEELAPRFKSLNFSHSSGLGVLFVGKSQPPAIESFFDMLETREGRDLVLRYFERLGQVVELEWQNAKLAQKLQRRERHIEEVRQSFSWRVTGPLRVAGRQLGRLLPSSIAGKVVAPPFSGE